MPDTFHRCRHCRGFYETTFARCKWCNYDTPRLDDIDHPQPGIPPREPWQDDNIP